MYLVLVSLETDEPPTGQAHGKASQTAAEKNADDRGLPPAARNGHA